MGSLIDLNAQPDLSLPVEKSTVKEITTCCCFSAGETEINFKMPHTGFCVVKDHIPVTIECKNHVTPYMHCMMNHTSQFMELHGSILSFTQQGLEKYDIMTKDYFRATSHEGEQCLIQILQKQNRMEYLEAKGVKRAKSSSQTEVKTTARGDSTNLASATNSSAGVGSLGLLGAYSDSSSSEED